MCSSEAISVYGRSGYQPIIRGDGIVEVREAGRYSMKRWATAIWPCFCIGLLLLATAAPYVHPYGPCHLAEQPWEEKEEKNGPVEEERAKEAVVHAVRRHCPGHRKEQSRVAFPHPSALHPRAAARRGQLCLADAMRGERGFHNGCGATLRC